MTVDGNTRARAGRGRPAVTSRPARWPDQLGGRTPPTRHLDFGAFTPTGRGRHERHLRFRQVHPVRRRLRRDLDHPERLCHRAAVHGVDRPHGHRLGGVHQRPLDAARPARDGEFSESAGTDSARRHQLVADLRLRLGGAGHRRLRRLRQHPVRRPGELERRSDHGAREHDHCATRLRRQRAGRSPPPTRNPRPSSTSTIKRANNGQRIVRVR